MLKEAFTLAGNLVRLSKAFKTSDPVQSSEIRHAFKRQSLNDCTRTIVYLLEVVGSRDAEFKRVQDENKDLRELLKLNNIALDEEKNEAIRGSETGMGTVAQGDDNGTTQTNNDQA